MKKEISINSQKYWDMRFSTDWESLDGPTQSKQFSRLAVNQLPGWLINSIKRDSLTLVDWGCAQGDGTEVWASYMPADNLHGVDFSPAAIEQATARYPDIHFECCDWLAQDGGSSKIYDIVFSSNTLEHFSNPYEVLRRLVAHANKAIVLLLPYKEINRIDEHEFTFLPHNIPAKIDNDFSLVYGRITGPHKVWAGEQILLVYAKDKWICEQKLTLNDIFVDSNNVNILQILQIELQKKKEKIAMLQQAMSEIRMESLDHLGQLRNHEAMARSAASELAKANEFLQQFKLQNEELQRNIATHESTISQLYRELLSVRASASWRITSPLRTAYQLVSKIGTPIFLRLPAGIRRSILHKINPSVHPVDSYSANSSGVEHVQNGMLGEQGLLDLPEWVKMARSTDKIAVIPCGFEFDELVNQRPINAAKYFARQGYFVLFIAWQWDKKEQLLKGCSHVWPGIYQVPLFEFVNLHRLLAPKKVDALYLVTMPARILVDCILSLRGKGYTIAYDVMDEWQEFFKSGQAPWYEKQVEEQLVLQSDMVCAVAPALVEKFACIRDDVLLIGNGYSEDVIGQENRGIAQPIGSNAIIGYFGHLTDAWFDWKLVFDLAARYKAVRFEIIGYGEPQWVRDQLGDTENVRLIGKVHPSELSNYVQHWSAGIIPFVEGQLSLAVDPIKIYEYIFFGLPVFVTGIQHLKTYPGVVCAKRDEALNQFASLLGKRQVDIEQVEEFLAATTWTARFNELVSKLKQYKNMGDFYGL